MPRPLKDDDERSYQRVPEDRLNEKWLSRTEARTILGVNGIAFQRLVATGELTQYRIDGNTRVFDPAEVADLSQTDLSDATVGTQQTSAPSENISAATKLVNQAHSHVEKLVTLVVSSAEKSQSMYEKTINTLSERITQLEKTHNEALRLKEDNAWNRLEREVVVEKLTGDETRKREMWMSIMPSVGPIVQGLSLGIANAMPWVKAAGGMAVQPAAEPASAPGVETAPPVAEAPTAPIEKPLQPVVISSTFAERAATLLASIGRDRLTMLVSAGVLDDEDTITLRQVIDDLPEATPQPKSDKESEVQS